MVTWKETRYGVWVAELPLARLEVHPEGGCWRVRINGKRLSCACITAEEGKRRGVAFVRAEAARLLTAVDTEEV
jgi:hypothetical protein